MKTGERGYILSQLAAHFGDRFETKEQFLKIFTQVADLTNEEIQWAKNFLDSFVDPVVALAFIDAEDQTDKMLAEEAQYFEIAQTNIDSLAPAESFAMLFKILLKDGFKKKHKYNGEYKYDGTIKYGGGEYSVTDVLRVQAAPAPSADTFNFREEAAFALGAGLTDAFGKRVKYNGEYKYNGAVKYRSAEGASDQFGLQAEAAIHLSEPVPISDGCALKIVDTAHYNGKYKYDGTRKYSAKIIEEVL
jgi:hypothetical protein